jgi:hypothetical protein
VRCETCAARYRPRLTAGTCPVCDTPAPQDEAPARRLAGRFRDPDDRMIAIVLFATVLNVLLLGLLTTLVVSH